MLCWWHNRLLRQITVPLQQRMSTYRSSWEILSYERKKKHRFSHLRACSAILNSNTDCRWNSACKSRNLSEQWAHRFPSQFAIKTKTADGVKQYLAAKISAQGKGECALLNIIEQSHKHRFLSQTLTDSNLLTAGLFAQKQMWPASVGK